jgi:mono/diheme cytochrome c family protein
MKKTVIASFLIPALLIFSLFLLSFPASAQNASKSPVTLPDEVSKIVTASCTPCHTSQGGLMSRTKLNFTEWANYSPAKQKEKAAKMYSELNKGAMPPKGAREKHPELIPTKEQAEVLKKWSESFPADNK